ncbi:MAG TPA: GNAT family N-acetyltransferase [Gemmatimonadales bacterium]|jgi:GNAT superfamily N-acetyltransferase
MATAFRLIGSHDIDQILQALRDGHAETGEPFAADRASAWLYSLLEDPETAPLWLIERNGAFAGFAMLHLAPDLSPRRAYVTGLYINPGLRGTGLGPTALSLLRDVARASGWKLMEHDVALEAKVPRVRPMPLLVGAARGSAA